MKWIRPFSLLTFPSLWRRSFRDGFQRYQSTKIIRLKLKLSAFQRCNQLWKYAPIHFWKKLGLQICSCLSKRSYSMLKATKRRYFQIIFLEYLCISGLHPLEIWFNVLKSRSVLKMSELFSIKTLKQSFRSDFLY